MLDLSYALRERGRTWEVRIGLSPEECPDACPVALALFDPEVARHAAYDGDRLRLARTLDRAAGDALIARLDAIHVPVVPRAELLGGFGGRLEEVRIARGECETRFRWWLDLPAGWEGLGELAAHLRALVEGFRAETLA